MFLQQISTQLKLNYTWFALLYTEKHQKLKSEIITKMTSSRAKINSTYYTTVLINACEIHMNRKSKQLGSLKRFSF